jgi:hypothetical protein
MRSRIPRLLAAAVTVTVLAASCGSDGGVDAVESNDTVLDDVDTDGTTPTGDPTPTGDTAGTATAPSQTTPIPTFEGRVTPAFPDEISGAADIRTVLAQLGFRPDWPLPDGLATSDVVGVKLSQSAGSDYYVTRASVAWRAPATDDPEGLSAEWYDTARDVFGVEESFGTGTITGNELEGFLNSGGSEEDPTGSLSVTVIRPEGDATAPVIIEIEHELQTNGSDPDLTLSPALLAALPDLTGCVPEIVSAEYRTYSSPNEFLDDPAYTTIFDANCATRASYDAASAWATTSGGSVNQTEDKVQVSEAPGPNGTTIQIYSSLADDGGSYLRTDTTAPIPAG